MTSPPTQAAPRGRSRVENFERYLRRQDNVEQPAIEQEGFILFIFLEKRAALTELFVTELELIESLNINENLPVGLRIAVSNPAGFQGRHRHALVLPVHGAQQLGVDLEGHQPVGLRPLRPRQV